MIETPLSRYLKLVLDLKSGHKVRSMPSRWNHSDVRRLMKLYDQNASWDEIYKSFPNRSRQAVKHKIYEYKQFTRERGDRRG